MIAFWKVVDGCLTDSDGEYGVSIVVGVHEEGLKIGQFDFDFDEEVWFVKATFMLELFNVGLVELGRFLASKSVSLM